MRDHRAISVRFFIGWIAMILGGSLGWGLVELGWRHVNQGMHWWGRPERGWGYALIAFICSLSVGVVGMAIVRLRDLPNGEQNNPNQPR